MRAPGTFMIPLLLVPVPATGTSMMVRRSRRLMLDLSFAAPCRSRRLMLDLSFAAPCKIGFFQVLHPACSSFFIESSAHPNCKMPWPAQLQQVGFVAAINQELAKTETHSLDLTAWSSSRRCLARKAEQMTGPFST